MSHPTHIVCPCNTPGMPGPCHFAQQDWETRIAPRVVYMPQPTISQDQIREWQEAWQRITMPKPPARPWRGVCPPIGAGQR